MNRRRILKRLQTFSVASLFLLGGVTAAIAQQDLTVFAASSLKDALDAVSAAWKAETGRGVVISYAGSPALARQIEQGAPADLFISADMDWMNRLSEGGFLKPGSTVQLLGNELVLIAPAASSINIKIQKGFDLSSLLAEGKLAMADVKSVPAGKYGKAALEYLGAWTAVAGKTAQTENVRAALKLVSTGEAVLGIVYLTDAKADAAVRIVDAFPSSSHPPIIYPASIIRSSSKADAADFLNYLQSDKAQAIFKNHGFTRPSTANP